MNIPIGGDNAYFLDLYSRYRKDRNSVPADWALHFEELEAGGNRPSASSGTDQIRLLLDAYRRYGHIEADLDPLGQAECSDPVLDELRRNSRTFADEVGEIEIGGEVRRMKVAEAERLFREIYTGSAALEAGHLDNAEDRHWWHAAFERSFSSPPDRRLVMDSLESVVLADEFETFMRTKFPTKKRFGSEGAETAMVFLRELLRAAPQAGIGEIIMGGMHRGRLAMLAVALGKNPATIAAELMGRDLSEGAQFTGDVPYHLGYNSSVDTGGGRVDLTLLPHPSHLMVVAPVALGLARAAATRRKAGSGEGQRVLGLLMHTDAAFSGQGLAFELLQLGGLDGYSAGGSIHLVVNNQIGFTTLPSEGRSARYCTDAAKAVGVPVIHVNGDDPVAVARAAGLALAWHRRSGKDVLIDLVAYRRYGHNELDEPRFTQPRTWDRIDLHPTIRASFSKRAAALYPEASSKADAVAAGFHARLQAGFDSAGSIAPNDEPVQDEAWGRLSPGRESELLEPVVTGVDIPRLVELGLAAGNIPEGIAAHPKVRQFYEARAQSIRKDKGVNFATAEALAFATLLADGAGVRLSGQDAVRGTFTQRHLVVHDVVTGRMATPLSAAASSDHALELINSPLSEYGVLGFEYGHSLLDSRQLTLWEAQFGDFMNGAQIVVDQYVVSAEAKWRLRSGLVLLLPHGLEGQGPDHSSARIERLLQLCAGGNVIVAQPSTPANLFHLLRRQLVAPWRKPLFLVAPKSLLRAKAAVSALAEMGKGTTFSPVIAEPCEKPNLVRRVVLCSGKIFYALNEARRAGALENAVVPVRIEQLYPFPRADLRAALQPFTQAELVWLQEEAENQGAAPFIRDLLAGSGVKLSAHRPIIARPAMSVTAAGSIERHEREQAELLARALAVGEG